MGVYSERGHTRKTYDNAYSHHKASTHSVEQIFSERQPRVAASQVVHRGVGIDLVNGKSEIPQFVYEDICFEKICDELSQNPNTMVIGPHLLDAVINQVSIGLPRPDAICLERKVADQSGSVWRMTGFYEFRTGKKMKVGEKMRKFVLFLKRLRAEAFVDEILQLLPEGEIDMERVEIPKPEAVSVTFMSPGDHRKEVLFSHRTVFGSVTHWFVPQTAA